MRRFGRTGISFVLAFGLGACGQPLTGTWQDRAGEATYHFERGGRASVSVLGARVAAEYTIDGDRVLVSSPQGTVVLKRKDDRLFGPMGRELIRQPE